MLPTMVLLLLVPSASDELKPPIVKFSGASQRNGQTRLHFQVINPNPVALPYHGYRDQAFEGGLKKGMIAPLYKLAQWQGNEWRLEGVSWSGAGIGDVSLPAKSKVHFEVVAPPGDWEVIRVGLLWFKPEEVRAAGRLCIAWSRSVSQKDVERSRR